ncbi:hypothetical protein [Actinomadura sp. B10D3]|uniref:hypothetical protein n=1 Tax=Actinomadura sp. B10D3 TaxID=3153557 RepID=UPI00325F141C
MRLKVGQALKSAVDGTAVIVTRAPAGDVVLTCGGVAMHPKGEEPPTGSPDDDQMGGTLLGKRYADAEGRLELLCTAGGSGTLAMDGDPLEVQGAKPLPASD